MKFLRVFLGISSVLYPKVAGNSLTHQNNRTDFLISNQETEVKPQCTMPKWPFPGTCSIDTIPEREPKKEKVIQQSPATLQYASEEFMLDVIKQDPEMIQYASDKLKADKDFMLAVVNKVWQTIYYASDELKADKEFMLDVVKQQSDTIQVASDALKADKEFMCKVIQKDPRTIQVASDELKSDKAFMLNMIQEHTVVQEGEWILFYLLRYASDELKADKAFMLDVIPKHQDTVQYASNELKADKAFMLDVIKQHSDAIQYASDELKTDLVFLVALFIEYYALIITIIFILSMMHLMVEKLQNNLNDQLDELFENMSNDDYHSKFCEFFEIGNNHLKLESLRQKIIHPNPNDTGTLNSIRKCNLIEDFNKENLRCPVTYRYLPFSRDIYITKTNIAYAYTPDLDLRLDPLNRQPIIFKLQDHLIDELLAHLVKSAYQDNIYFNLAQMIHPLNTGSVVLRRLTRIALLCSSACLIFNMCYISSLTND